MVLAGLIFIALTVYGEATSAAGYGICSFGAGAS
jgi:hypothetical protein